MVGSLRGLRLREAAYVAVCFTQLVYSLYFVFVLDLGQVTFNIRAEPNYLNKNKKNKASEGETSKTFMLGTGICFKEISGEAQ